MKTIDNQTRPEIWTCTDGATIRAGDKRLAIWWTVETMEQAQAIVDMMSRFTASQCIAMFRN